MEMRITITAAGATLGKSGLGFNRASAAYIEVRTNKDCHPTVHGLSKVGSLGSNTGSLVFGHVQPIGFRSTRTSKNLPHQEN